MMFNQSLAYRLAPCVIFIDELDSLFKARSGKDDRQYQRNIVSYPQLNWLFKSLTVCVIQLNEFLQASRIQCFLIVMNFSFNFQP